MRRVALAVLFILLASASFAGDTRLSVTLKPDVIDVKAAGEELAATYGGRLVEINGGAVILDISIARSGLVARDPHVVAVTVLGSAMAKPAFVTTSPTPQPTSTVLPPALHTPRANANDACVGAPVGYPCSSGTYQYDGSGNIKSIGPDTFAYDLIDRLKTATLPSASADRAHAIGETYTYDPFGNLTNITAANDIARNNVRTPLDTDQASNHLKATTPTLATYDEAGNLKAWQEHVYTYDASNMLVEMLETTVSHAVYIYTADDERIATLSLAANNYSGTWRIRGLDNKVLRELRENNTVGQTPQWSWSRDYIYRNGLLLSSYGPAPNSTETRVDYHLDHLGTARLITDVTGRQVSIHHYFPFGMEITEFAGSAEVMKFTGHERDFVGGTTTGNEDYHDYLHARFDNPHLGRFLSVDMHAAKPAVPQSWNRYAYGKNNPLNRIDPNGLEDVIIFKTERNARRDPSDPWAKAATYLSQQYSEQFRGKYARVDVFILNVDHVSQVNRELSQHKDIVKVSFVGHSDSTKIAIGSADAPDTNISMEGGRNDVSPSKLNWSNLKPEATIDIMGCHAGQGDDSIAQSVANASGVPVTAPDAYLNFDDSNGKPFIRWFRAGEFITFKPQPKVGPCVDGEPDCR